MSKWDKNNIDAAHTQREMGEIHQSEYNHCRKCGKSRVVIVDSHTLPVSGVRILCEDCDAESVNTSGVRAESAEAALAASRAPDPVANAGSDQPVERYQHIKRGTTYQVIGRGLLQTDAPLADYAEVVAYRCEETGDVWVRPQSEFTPDRFRALQAAPVAEAQPVAWLIEGYGTTEHKDFAFQYGTKTGKAVTPLYTHPPMQPTIGGAELDALVATEAMVDAAFKMLPPDAHGTIGSGEMYRVLESALRAQPDWKAMAERLGACVRIGDHGGIIWRPGPTRAALSDLAKMKGE